MRSTILAALIMSLVPWGSRAQDAPVPHAPDDEATLTASLYPPPLRTRERLRRLIVELWCAERAGADDAALLQLYLKHSFPPLNDWHNVWNRALEDSAWIRDVYDEVRAACPGSADVAPPGTEPSPR